LNETKVPGACVTGPLVRAKGYKGRDTFTVPEGRKQQVVSTKLKKWSKCGLVSITYRGARGTVPMSAMGPGRVKTFFILQNCALPGVIHVNATI